MNTAWITFWKELNTQTTLAEIEFIIREQARLSYGQILRKKKRSPVSWGSVRLGMV
jgi:hypothetical protein